MKLQAFFILSCCLFPFLAFCQAGVSSTSSSEYSKLNIGFEAGASLPAHLFGKAPASGSPANPVVQRLWNALPGFNLAVHATWMFSKHWGVQGAVRGNVNANDDLRETNDVISPPVKITSEGDYYNWQGMAGPFVSLPLTKKVDFTAQVLIGVLVSSSPTITQVDYGNGLPFNSTFVYHTGSGFAYSAGVGAKYKLDNRFSLSLNASYTGADVRYPSYSITDAGNNGGHPQTIDSPSKMAVELIQVSAGIVYSF